MKNLFALLTVSAFMFTGCYPQAVVLWSSDGQHGAVLAKDKIYFCDPQGKLSPQSLEYSGLSVTWGPASNDLYYISQLQLGTWKEASAYLDAAKQAELESQAKDALSRLKPDDLKDEKNNPFAKFDGEDTILMLLYLKDNHAAALKAKLDKKTFEDIAKIKASLNQLFVCKNCDWANPQLILQTFMSINWLNVSPNGKAVAFLKSDKTLYVCDMKGRISLVAGNAAALPDWTPDGGTLTYSSATTDKPASGDLQLGSIKQVQIFDGHGEMLKKFPQPKELAGVLFHETCKIRCLKNGWIIFSSAAIKLPATAKEMPQQQSLFAITPELSSTVINMIPQETRQNMGATEWDTFQLSPDQKRLAVLGSDRKILTILTIANSNVQKISLGLNDNMKPFLPTWQNNDTLCLLTGTSDTSGKNGVSVLLSSNGNDRFISRDWPAEVIESITEKYEDKKDTKSAETKPVQDGK